MADDSGNVSTNAPSSSPENESAAKRAETLFREHTRAVLAVCLAHTRTIQDAEDMMQETFVKSFRKIGSLRDHRRLAPWLLKIARRTCTDNARRRTPIVGIESDVPTPVPENDNRIRRLREALSKLPLRLRETISLYYLDGLSCTSVARSLGVSESAVRQRLVRARLKLHDLLVEDEQ